MQNHSCSQTHMELSTYPTSLGIVKEMILDDGFEKITLISHRESDEGQTFLLVSNLNLIETDNIMMMISKCLDRKGEHVEFDTEEEFLVFLLTGRWALEKQLDCYQHSRKAENNYERLLYIVNTRLKDYLLDPYHEDDGARH